MEKQTPTKWTDTEKLSPKSKVIQATQGTKIKDSSDEDLFNHCVYVCSLFNIDPPCDPEASDYFYWNIISEFLTTGEFRGYTLEDIKLAGKMNLEGTIEEVIPYRGFTPEFIGKLFRNYSKVRQKHLATHAQEIEKPKEMTEEEKKENERVLKEDMKEDFEATCKGHDWKKPWSFKYDKLVHTWEVMPEPSDEKKWEFVEAARKEIEEDKRQRRMENPFSEPNQSECQRAKVLAVKDWYLKLSEARKHLRNFLE